MDEKFKRARAVNQFKKLLGLIKKQNQEILDDPVKYLQIASQEIDELRQVLRKLDDTLHRRRSPDYFKEHLEATFHQIETISITQEDYESLTAAKQIINDWRKQNE